MLQECRPIFSAFETYPTCLEGDRWKLCDCWCGDWLRLWLVFAVAILMPFRPSQVNLRYRFPQRSANVRSTWYYRASIFQESLKWGTDSLEGTPVVGDPFGTRWRAAARCWGMLCWCVLLPTTLDIRVWAMSFPAAASTERAAMPWRTAKQNHGWHTMNDLTGRYFFEKIVRIPLEHAKVMYDCTHYATFCTTPKVSDICLGMPARAFIVRTHDILVSLALLHFQVETWLSNKTLSLRSLRNLRLAHVVVVSLLYLNFEPYPHNCVD